MSLMILDFNIFILRCMFRYTLICVFLLFVITGLQTETRGKLLVINPRQSIMTSCDGR